MKLRSLMLTLVLSAAGISAALPLDIVLPTKNDALFTGPPEKFYMYVNRYTEGVKTTPREGGMYGFVRDPRVTPHGTIYTRFHGGIDIRPLQRDEKGNPLDEVAAISAGRVVHVSPRPGASNYGRYIVIEHQWDGCPYYSLYAHLGEISVEPGAEVQRGQKIAIMGFTGRGIDRERAHLHLEIALLMNEHFESFYPQHWGSTPNVHGIYSGLNLRGLDVARLYLQACKNPKLTIPEFLSQETPFFHVDLPGSHPIDLLKRYPWMAGDEFAKSAAAPAAWRISFAQSGVPIRVRPLKEPITAGRVTVEMAAQHPLHQLTSSLLAGTGSAASLTKSGERLVALLTHDPQNATASSATPQIVLASDKTHTVKKGETIIAIASKHKIDPAELQQANQIKDPKQLQIGQVLVIPSAGEAAAEKRNPGDATQ